MRKVTALFATIALMSVVVQCVRGEVVVSDDFSLDGKTRVAGASLAGMPVQKGTGKWKLPGSYDNTVFTADGKASNAVASGPRASEALVEIPEPTAPVTVQADLVTDTAGWVGVGLLTTDTAIWFTNENVLFALIEPKGRWVLYRSGATLTKLAAGGIADYSSKKPCTLALRYDPAATTAVVMINGKDVCKPTATGLDPATEIGAAGFYIYTLDTTTPGHASVGNFKVETASK